MFDAYACDNRKEVGVGEAIVYIMNMGKYGVINPRRMRRWVYGSRSVCLSVCLLTL